jgi:hypothetical protein
MRKKLSLLLVSILCISSSAAYAEDSFWADDSSPQGKIGLVWYEDVLRSGNGVSTVTAFNDVGEQYVCSSVTEAKCATFKNRQVEVMLPACEGSSYTYCIEGVQIGSEGSQLKSAKLDRYIDGTTVPEDPRDRIPYGGTTSLWKASGAPHTGGSEMYAVGVRLRYSISKGDVQLNNFEASIVPYREAVGMEYRFMQTKLAKTYGGVQIVHDWHVGNCIWQEQSLCGIATRWSANSVASLTLRVPNKVTGWLHGRLESPTIAISKINSESNRITVTAKPVTVEGSAPKVKVSEITPALMKVITRSGAEPLRSDSGYVWQLEPSYYNFDWFSAWLPYTQDKADGFSDYWNFKSIAGNFTTNQERTCLSSTSKLIGLVTTNSLWYSGMPPVFKNSDLNYKVAALHFNPDGVTPFLGTYDLIIDSKAARCLYGYSAAPVEATISVLSASGENQVATSTINEDNGWLSLSAKGFTFSDPTIKIKLTQAGSKPTSPIATSIAKKTILCKKGILEKKVTGVSPVCPTGYKKIG